MAKILIIDDDHSIRRTLQLALKKLGHQVIEAEDGQAGLAAYRSTAVDLVITDIVMPNMEGIETIMEFRRCSPSIKIIAMSGGGRVTADEYLAMARKLGAKRTISKPFSIEELSAAVLAVLNPT